MQTIDLRQLASLRDYTNSELRLLASVAPAREYARDASLCREGQPGQSCFLLAVGEVSIRKNLPGGEKTLATLKAGQVVGQMALVDRSPRSASVVAAEDTIALELTRDVFENLLKSSSPLALRFQEQIAIAGIRQLRMANQRLKSLLLEQKDAAAAKPKPEELQTISAALQEWDLHLDDVPDVEVVKPPR